MVESVFEVLAVFHLDDGDNFREAEQPFGHWKIIRRIFSWMIQQSGHRRLFHILETLTDDGSIEMFFPQSITSQSSSVSTCQKSFGFSCTKKSVRIGGGDHV